MRLVLLIRYKHLEQLGAAGHETLDLLAVDPLWHGNSRFWFGICYEIDDERTAR